MNLNTCHVGDCRSLLLQMAAASVRAQMCVTSPPYFGLRDYGHPGQLGIEATPTAYVDQLVSVFAAVREVLADDGTVWLNLGDSYAGSWGAQGRRDSSTNASHISRNQIKNHPKRAQQTSTIRVAGVKPKDLYGIPWRVAFALQADGWYLRSDIIWHKPNPMPESVTDRPTKAHEYLFLLSKREHYYYDAAAINEAAEDRPVTTWDDRKAQGEPLRRGDPGESGHITRTATLASVPGVRNRRSVWTVATQPFDGAHFATFPRALIEPCVLAGSRPGDVVLDPFMGSGTTAQVAEHLGRQWIGCEINPDYMPLQANRLSQRAMAF